MTFFPTNTNADAAALLEPLKNDTETQVLDNIMLKSTDGDLVSCSRAALCKRSEVLRDTLMTDTTSNAEFAVPFPTTIVRELRYVCYFETSSIFTQDSIVQDSTCESKMRVLCKLLIAVDYYQMEETISQNIYDLISTAMSRRMSLACVVIDEFGFVSDSSEDSKHSWIAKASERAACRLEQFPFQVLLCDGICEIQDAGKIRQILMILKTSRHGTVSLEFEALLTWMAVCWNLDDEVSASTLKTIFKESEILKRLIDDDPNLRHSVYAFASGTRKGVLKELYMHAQAKNSGTICADLAPRHDWKSLLLSDSPIFPLCLTLFAASMLVYLYLVTVIVSSETSSPLPVSILFITFLAVSIVVFLCGVPLFYLVHPCLITRC